MRKYEINLELTRNIIGNRLGDSNLKVTKLIGFWIKEFIGNKL